VPTHARAFRFPHIIPIKESPHQSPPLVLTPHHIDLYPLVEEKNKYNEVEMHPDMRKMHEAQNE